MPRLTSGSATLLSGSNHLTSEEEDDMGMLVAPTVDTGSNVTSTSTSLTDIDATNFAITFTAPASGNVVVIMSGTAQLDTTTGKLYYWGLRESTTDIQAKTIAESIGVGVFHYKAVRFYITGLTPGSSHTYKGAHKRTTGATFGIVGGADDPRILEVWEAL
jgi:hypothetical protein